MGPQKLSLDEHEHLITLYNLPLMKKKAIQELHGAASAIIYDGEVTNDEIDFIAAWIDRNRIVHDVWPVSRLIEILTDITNPAKTPAQCAPPCRESAGAASGQGNMTARKRPHRAASVPASNPGTAFSARP